MKATFLFIVILIPSLHAQEFPYKKLREVKLKANAERISVDRLGGFYTVNNCGIEQFDPEGKAKKNYSPRGCTDTELLEAWSLMRIYAYQKYKQHFIVFDHNMEVVETKTIDPAFAIDPQLATPSADLKSYWIFDTDNSIKKIDLKSNSVVMETESLVGVKGKFIHIREYQGLLFFLDTQSGIYVLDKLGNKLHKIDVKAVTYFSFAGEDLYYLNENKLTFYNIFSYDTYSIDVPTGNKFAIVTDERLILIKEQAFDVFEFTPRK